jgi:uncharacterized protein YndB with AHSA1/START domain
MTDKNVNDKSGLLTSAATITRRNILLGAAVGIGGLSVGTVRAWAAVDDGISHTAAAIHQEPVFKATRKRVYEALTDAAQFHKVSLLSEAVLTGMVSNMKATEISREVGGAFSLYGGYLTGRHVELVPNERIVQVWRAGSWDLGVHSIIRFELVEDGSGTRIRFDHRGFPDERAQHLADGWKGNYWEPLAKYLEGAS